MATREEQEWCEGVDEEQEWCEGVVTNGKDVYGHVEVQYAGDLKVIPEPIEHLLIGAG